MTKIKSSDAIISPLSSLCSFVQYKKSYFKYSGNYCTLISLKADSTCGVNHTVFIDQ